MFCFLIFKNISVSRLHCQIQFRLPSIRGPGSKIQWKKESKHRTVINKQRATFFFLSEWACAASTDEGEECPGNEGEDATWDCQVMQNVNIQINSLVLTIWILDCNLVAELRDARTKDDFTSLKHQQSERIGSLFCLQWFTFILCWKPQD